MKRDWFSFVGRLVLGIAVTAVPTLAAQAQLWTGIHHNISGVPGYEVPGLGNTGFKFSASTATNLYKVYTYGNEKWALVGSAELPTTEDDVLLIDGQLVVREGTSTPFAAGENFGPIVVGSTLFAINDAGTFVLRNNTDGPDAADEYVLLNTGGSYSIVAKEGQPSGFVANANWDGALQAVNITQDGRVGFVGSLSGSGVISTTNQVAVLGNQVLAQKGVTVPGNQAGGATGVLISLNQLSIKGDGNSYILSAGIAGSGAALSHYSAIVDGNVVIERGQTAAGMFSPVTRVIDVYMDAGGNWFAEGANQNSQNWIVRNGTKIAALDEPVAGGPSVWVQFSAAEGEGFSFMTGNSVGDWLIGGWDNSGAGGIRNALMMLNGEVLARQGDPVDLDGNGLFDDNAFFGGRFGSAAITDNGTIFVTALLQNGAGTPIGAGFFALQGNVVPEPASIALVLLGCVALVGIRRRRS